MDKRDIGFFEEIQGVLANKRQPVRGKKSEDKPKASKGKKQASELDLRTLSGTLNPCIGCPNEGKQKLLNGVGDPQKAKLVVVTERVTESELINQGIQHGKRFQALWPLFEEEGFQPEDVYWVSLTRCPGPENLIATQNCLEYLRRELAFPNVKCILLIGLRVFQLLVDKKRTSVFHARGRFFSVLEKTALVTFERID